MSDNTEKVNVKSEAWEWIKALVIALALVFLIRWLLFSPFLVSGQSMEPNFYDGERLIVNKILYDFRDPKRGEVIVFLAPDGRDYIKRVIGVPGDRVKVEGDTVYVNGQPIDEPYLKEAIEAAKARGVDYNNTNKEETVVQPGTLFVMGDNRSHSSDSRSNAVGLVPYDKIVGRAEVVFWPLSHIKLAR
ncbi:signal peptidase I [Paenibacillus thermoaerophilus]|uniref:Signal peptidase I n=1 Tax=Paenibacillus thermoaerophilus TaxID=1215385 RepID=A0ABW2UY21_9BACL|nr:signal peptidase I [Paenibacillus thermoaerophilus]TMV19196.1 signal peptidase I [Paenibacillus thermoaerophilus]